VRVAIGKKKIGRTTAIKERGRERQETFGMHNHRRTREVCAKGRGEGRLNARKKKSRRLKQQKHSRPDPAPNLHGRRHRSGLHSVRRWRHAGRTERAQPNADGEKAKIRDSNALQRAATSADGDDARASSRTANVRPIALSPALGRQVRWQRDARNRFLGVLLCHARRPIRDRHRDFAATRQAGKREQGNRWGELAMRSRVYDLLHG
jgi:hypothetical protein